MKKLIWNLYHIRKPFDEYNYLKMGSVLGTIFLVFTFFLFFFLFLIDYIIYRF